MVSHWSRPKRRLSQMMNCMLVGIGVCTSRHVVVVVLMFCKSSVFLYFLSLIRKEPSLEDESSNLLIKNLYYSKRLGRSDSTFCLLMTSHPCSHPSKDTSTKRDSRGTVVLSMTSWSTLSDYYVGTGLEGVKPRLHCLIESVK